MNDLLNGIDFRKVFETPDVVMKGWISCAIAFLPRCQLGKLCIGQLGTMIPDV